MHKLRLEESRGFVGRRGPCHSNKERFVRRRNHFQQHSRFAAAAANDQRARQAEVVGEDVALTRGKRSRRVRPAARERSMAMELIKLPSAVSATWGSMRPPAPWRPTNETGGSVEGRTYSRV